MTAFYTHPAFFKHEMGEAHPESPQRLWAIHDHLTRKGLMALLDVREPVVAPDHGTHLLQAGVDVVSGVA